jgi:hypothetical protein
MDISKIIEDLDKSNRKPFVNSLSKFLLQAIQKIMNYIH